MSNKSKLYTYVVLLFIFTFLFTSRIMKEFKLNEFNYFKLGINALVLVFLLFQIIKIGKIENNKSE